MKNRSFQYFVILLITGLLINSTIFAQEVDLKNYRIRFNLNTVKQADNSRTLEVSFLAANKKNRKDRVPIYKADIEFYNFLNEEEVKLGIAKTNEEGIAKLSITEDNSYLVDDEGYINFKAVFEGTDGLNSKDDEIAVKDIFLELDLKEIDSVKTVLLTAHTLDSLKTKVPVEELDVVFAVGGMISKMPIEEATIEDGEYEFEFPTNIRGDKDANINVFASIEDHDDYGNVVVQKPINWGTFNKQAVSESNTLWSEAAPIWMYVVLTILLVGVWANYIYSFFNLLKIKKEGKELELESENKENT